MFISTSKRVLDSKLNPAIIPGVSEKKYGVADYWYLRIVTHSNVIFSDIINTPFI